VRLSNQDARAQREALAYLKKHKKLPQKQDEGTARSAKVLLPRDQEKLVDALLELWDPGQAEEFQRRFANALDKVRRRPEADPTPAEGKAA
jgi:hypothetical protein